MKSTQAWMGAMAAAFLAPAASSPAAPATPAEKPNIIFILADDLGFGELGCYGGKEISTPNIDRLAAGGLRFTNAYSVSSVCAPTRCGIMTGKHMGHATRRANVCKNGAINLLPEEVTVAKLLKADGYATGGFGKWGLGNPGSTGAAEKQGFDVFYGYYDQGHAHNYFPAFLVRNGEDVPMPGGDGVKGKAGKGTAYSQDLIADETLKFIGENKDRPFFCYAAWTLPHMLYEIPSDAPYSDKPWDKKAKIYAAMITRLDADVGRIMDKLKELGLEDRTLIVFTSDNGPADYPFVTRFNGAGGLRGFKRSLFEGGIRTPFIARWPGVIKPGTTSDLLCGQVDFLATACDLAGITIPTDTDGLSLAPTLRGEPPAKTHDSLYWEAYEKLPFQQAVRTGKWKGYRTALKGTLELYDLEADPAESKDVAGAHPDVVRQIEEIMAREHVTSPNWDPVEMPGQAASDEEKPARKKGKKKDNPTGA